MAGRVIDATLRFIDNFTRPMQQAMGSLTQNGRTFIRAGKQIEAAGKTIANTGKAMTKAVTVPIVGMGVAAAKTAADFETAMDKVASISGDTGRATKELVSLADEMGLSYKKNADGSASAMEVLSAKALQMGAITKFSASEAADAFSYMAMAGWDTQSMMEGIEGIMYLAGATGEDLAATSDIVTDALTAFGMQANETNRFVDVLAQTANRSNTDVAMMGETFQYVAPVAGALGFAVEDTAVAIGLMANSGIKASTAGTALRSLMTNLAKPTKAMKVAMSDLGISLTDSSGNMKTLNAVMQEMRGAFANLTEAEKAKYAATIAGKTGMSGMLAIVNASEGDFQKLTVAMNESTGAAKAMYDVANDNLNGQLTILKSTIESIAITFGNKLLPYIKTGVGKLQALAEVVSNLNDEQVSSAIKWAGIAASIGPAVWAFGTAVKVIGSAVVAIGKFKVAAVAAGGVVPLLTGPAGIAIAVVGGLAAAGVLLWKNWDKVKTFFIGFGKNIKSVFNESGTTIFEFAEKFDGIRDKFSGVARSAKEIWQIAGPYVKEFGKVVFDVFQTTLGVVLGGAIGLFNSAADSLLDYIDKMTEALGGFMEFFGGVFTGDWDRACKGLKTSVQASFDALVVMAKAPTEAVEHIVKGMASQLSKIEFKSIGMSIERAVDLFKSFKTKAGNSIGEIGSELKSFGKNIKSVFNESGQKIGEFTNRFKGIREKFSEIISGAKELHTLAGAYMKKIGLVMETVFQNQFGDIVVNAKKKWDDMSKKSSEFWQQASPYIEKFGEIAKLVFQVRLGAYIGGAIGLFNSVVNTTVNVVDGIVTVLHGLIEFIAGAFTQDSERACAGAAEAAAGGFAVISKLFNAPVNAVIGLINGAVSQINKLGVKIPEWVPKYGGKDFSVNLPTLTYLYKGTDNWRGGPAMIHDRGAEIVDLPSGTRVYPHDKSLQIARAEGARSTSITIPKIADTIIIREEADIDKFMDKMVKKIEEVAPNMA